MLDTLAAKKNVFATVFGTDESPTAIRFEDTGQSLLQKLGDLLKGIKQENPDFDPTQPVLNNPSEQIKLAQEHYEEWQIQVKNLAALYESEADLKQRLEEVKANRVTLAKMLANESSSVDYTSD